MFGNVSFRTANIVSGVPGATWIVPVAIAFSCTVFHHYRAKAQKLRKLQAMAQEALRQQFRESVEGSRHIRAFGWRQENTLQTLQVLNDSSKCFHSQRLLEGWMLSVFELQTTIILPVLVALGTKNAASSQSSLSVSFWSALCLSHALSMTAKNIVTWETSSDAVSELFETIDGIPVENHIDGVELPASWPQRGIVQFRNVTAHYK